MRFLLFLSIFALSSCAVSYKAPTSQAPTVKAKHNLSKNELTKKAQKLLMLDGFTISSIDLESGLISTNLKSMKIDASMADCGTTMGLNYLEDNRTSTQMAINVFVEDSEIQIKAIIHGKYTPGDVVQNIDLNCVSKGKFERLLIAKITG